MTRTFFRYPLRTTVEAVGRDWFKLHGIATNFHCRDHLLEPNEIVTLTVEVTHDDDKQEGSPRESDHGGS